MEKINIAEILRYCPSGTKLYSTIHGEIELVNVYNNLIRCKNSHDINFISFYSDGRWLENVGECVLFPSKENRDWSKFNRPFKDGDILHIDCTDESDDKQHEYIFILDRIYNGEVHSYCHYYMHDGFHPRTSYLADDTYPIRFATEEEKNILFEAIKNNGYKWYPDTKSLVKLFKPNFKVGDTIKNKTDKWLANRTIKSYVEGIGYFTTINDWVRINEQDNWELVKDITPIFKIGDKIKKKDGSDYRLRTIESINYNFYIIKTPDWFDNCYITDKLPFNCQDEYELIHSNKFDINTLKPFESRVLVRDKNTDKWRSNFWGFYDIDHAMNYPYECCGNSYVQCIPYEGNEHLLGTTNDCEEYFKTWKS